jgi:hypothetical protein
VAFTVYASAVGRLEYETGQWTIQAVPLSDLDRLAYERYEQERTKQQAENEAAELRAATLLLTYLSPEQAEQYRQTGHFDLVGSLGGQYRIRPGHAYNVQRRCDGAEVVTLCGGPSGLPRSDVMLAQYLALVADEAGFLSIANYALPDAICSCVHCRD